MEVTEEVTQALREVRQDANEVNFAVVGLSEQANVKSPISLNLLHKGSSGVSGIAEGVKIDDINYCLLRVDFTYEAVGNIKSEGSKFLFIVVRPDSLSLKRKMVVGPLEGQIKKLFSPFIKFVEISEVSLLNEAYIKNIVDSITQKKDFTTDKKGEDMLVAGAYVKTTTHESEKKKAQIQPDTRARFSFTEGAEVVFEDEENLKVLINKIRDGSLQWVLVAYKDKRTLETFAEGTGDFDEMLNACPVDKICYGLFRLLENYSSGVNSKGEKTVKIDQVKFGFLTYVPQDDISPVMKALVSTHKGAVVNKFRPFHNQFFVQSKTELNQEKVADAFASVSGLKSNVTERQVQKKEEKYERKFVGGATKETQELKYNNKEDLDAGIREVRSDSSPVIFALAEFTGEKKNIELKFVGTGSSFDELEGLLKDDAIQYVLLRTKELFDGYNTTKFNLIKFDGAAVSITQKGAIGVFHGAVTQSFGSYHTYSVFTDRNALLAKFTV